MADEITLVAAAYIVLKEKSKNKKKRMWIRPYFNRGETLDNLCLEVSLDEKLFDTFSRMSKSDFELLLNKIGPKIKRNDTNMRNAIPITTRLAITPRYLATGDSFKSLMLLFRVSDASISVIIPEVCAALIEGLKEFIKIPSGSTEWKQVAKDFRGSVEFPSLFGCNGWKTRCNYLSTEQWESIL